MKKQILLTFTFLILIISSFSVLALNPQKTLGDPNAPVTIELFTEFQDPFSARWYKETFPLIRQNYIATGKVKLTFKNFPLQAIHPNSLARAEAAECAAQQGYYFKFIDPLYSSTSTTHPFDQIQLSKEDFINIASSLGMNVDEFSNCLSDYNIEIQKIINADIQEGNQRGVNGVPNFFINGNLLSGAQPYKNFEIAIENAIYGETPNEEINPEARDIQPEPIRGNKDAKVHIIGYMGGYNRVYSQWSWVTINTLFNEFGVDKINFEFRNNPWYYDDPDYTLSQAGECVLSLSDQSTFFEYSNILFNKQNDKNSAISDAVSLGIDSGNMKRCMLNKRLLPEVLDDLDKGKQVEITGTPTFFINNQRIEGAQSYETFQKAVKKELSETHPPRKYELYENTPINKVPTTIEPIQEASQEPIVIIKEESKNAKVKVYPEDNKKTVFQRLTIFLSNVF